MKLAIVVKTMAPYRTALYEEIARELGSEDEVCLIGPELDAPDHDWTDLRPSEEFLSFRQVPSRFVESRLLARFYRNQEKSLRVPLPSLAMSKVLNATDPDVVWVHECSPFVLSAAGWAWKKGRDLVFSSELGQEGRSRLPVPLRAVHGAITNRARLIIAHTRDTESMAKERGKEVVFAPHAIREPPPAGPRESKARYTFLHAGSLIHRKGIDILLEAVRELSGRGREFRLILAGGKPDEDYEAMAREFKIEDCVEFSGFVEGDALEQLYRETDCFVLASRYDTYGAVTHEAASYGCALLISRNAGSSQVLVEDGLNGWVIAPDARDLAEKMREVMDGGLSAEAGEHSRMLAKKFGVENNAKRVAGALKALG